MTDLSLAEKVEGLACPCRETDMLVFAALHGWDVPFVGAAIVDWKEAGYPSYTASLDTVCALIKKELPGRAWAVIGAFSDGKPAGFISQDAGPIDLLKATSATGATPALALLSAFLRAKGEQNG